MSLYLYVQEMDKVTIVKEQGEFEGFEYGEERQQRTKDGAGELNQGKVGRTMGGGGNRAPVGCLNSCLFTTVGGKTNSALI